MSPYVSGQAGTSSQPLTESWLTSSSQARSAERCTLCRASRFRAVAQRQVTPEDDEIDEGWERETDEPDIRGVSAYKGVGGWQVSIAAQELFRQDPLGLELRQRVQSVLQAVEGVTGVEEDDNETWLVTGNPSGEGLMGAATKVVDGLADRMRRGHAETVIKFLRAGMLAVVVMAGGFTVWYRATYHVWPGQEVSRVHWCGRDYQAYPGRSETWPQVASDQRWPVHQVGWYPPLGWPHQELFAATFPAELRHSARPPLSSCAVVVYLRTGPGKYKAYSLEGGP